MKIQSFLNKYVYIYVIYFRLCTETPCPSQGLNTFVLDECDRWGNPVLWTFPVFFGNHWCFWMFLVVRRVPKIDGLTVWRFDYLVARLYIWLMVWLFGGSGEPRNSGYSYSHIFPIRRGAEELLRVSRPHDSWMDTSLFLGFGGCVIGVCKLALKDTLLSVKQSSLNESSW